MNKVYNLVEAEMFFLTHSSELATCVRAGKSQVVSTFKQARDFFNQVDPDDNMSFEETLLNLSKAAETIYSLYLESTPYTKEWHSLSKQKQSIQKAIKTVESLSEGVKIMRWFNKNT